MDPVEKAKLAELLEDFSNQVGRGPSAVERSVFVAVAKQLAKVDRELNELLLSIPR